MKNKHIANAFRLISFLLIAVLLFGGVSYALERKTLYGQANYMAKLNEFYDLPEDTMEYICIGSSHMYCSVNPLEVWNETGIKGFVLATRQQPLVASYHYIKEAFKTQSPKLVILEGLMVVPDLLEEGVYYEAIDPLRPSLNKLQMINNLIEPNKRDPYYFNVIKYHTRWKELSFTDIAAYRLAPNDRYKGYIPFSPQPVIFNQVPDYQSITSAKITEDKLKALLDIKELVEENGAKFMIMIAPFNIQYQGASMKALREFAEENDMEYIDYALKLDELGIDPVTDYVDNQHLAVGGAAKLSRHFATVLKEKGLEAAGEDKTWDDDYKYYIDTTVYY